MEIKYTKHFLTKLEDIFAESSYFLRYERGNFKSGWCMLNDQNVVVVNKFYDVEGKVNVLIDILNTLDFSKESLGEKNKTLLAQLNTKGGQSKLAL